MLHQEILTSKTRSSGHAQKESDGFAEKHEIRVLVRVHRCANPARDRRGGVDDARHDAARRERLQDVGSRLHRHVRGLLCPRAGIRVSNIVRSPV